MGRQMINVTGANAGGVCNDKIIKIVRPGVT